MRIKSRREASDWRYSGASSNEPGSFLSPKSSGAVLFDEWSACQSQDLRYSNGDSWDRMLRQGIMQLTRFCQDNRVQVHQLRRNLQMKFPRPIGEKNDFVAYIDAIGKLDGIPCLLEWKTSSSRYPESLRACCLRIRSWSATPG